MKKTFIIIFAIAGLSFGLPACKKFTEITPKGSNILNRVSDLDLLLNFNYTSNSATGDTLSAKTTAQAAFSAYDVGNLVNDTYAYSTNIPSLLSAKPQTLHYAYTVYDESVDRKLLAVTDVKYEKMYFLINNVYNVVLKNADAATGDRALAEQYKAESYILRAYMHYLLVNLYAKAYDPATASTDGGVPYVKEDNSTIEPNRKSTIAEVYANILADIDAGFQLNRLPATPKNNMRVGLGFAHAVKATVLMSLHRYPEALSEANKSLAINSFISNDRLFAPVGTAAFGKPQATAQENLFYMAQGGNPLLSTPSLEITEQIYEPGNIIHHYVKPYYPSGNPFSGLPTSKLWLNSATPYAINTAGLTTSDTYLIKAECLLRSGDLDGALEIINLIRQNRIHPNTYAPVSASTEAGVMALLGRTRRIELLFTMRNYFNLKRLTTDPQYKPTITRTIEGNTYSLSPESPLWIFPFPQSATNYNANLSHNY
ncbi:RagB/SusD family nutrient uptake outer membrane protein [Pedobacter deserti]|uniref:RagB/SusD family nutrient uptake outer membrane protein n=1 Tax=Pedobacter deserti TaxID=2817382 RepID=UPI0021098F81|nr:RagB/SusD family nutrient uptake outer membrane protein [Pedobacter sp. SYSU D00382]